MADLGDLSGFKTYEEWQAANRAAGGPGESAQVKSMFTGNTGGQANTQGGTTQYTGPADTTAWKTNVGMTDEAHPDSAGPSGDPFVDMIRNGAHGSEDYKRFSNAQILAWKDKYVPGSNPPKFKNDFGDVVDKPTESGPQSQAAGYSTGELDAGKAGGGGGGGRGGGGGATPPGPPPPPTTFGSQLSYTGNPLTDMLLYQFNSGTQLSDPSKMNAFAMGQDRQEGGAGADADQQKRTGQLLGGGGLWWQEGEAKPGEQDTFSGFRADTKNAEPGAAAPAAAAAPASTLGGVLSSNFAGGGASQQAEGAKLTGAAPEIGPMPATAQPAGIGNMLSNNRQTWRTKAGGVDSPFEAQAF